VHLCQYDYQRDESDKDRPKAGNKIKLGHTPSSLETILPSSAVVALEFVSGGVEEDVPSRGRTWRRSPRLKAHYVIDVERSCRALRPHAEVTAGSNTHLFRIACPVPKNGISVRRVKVGRVVGKILQYPSCNPAAIFENDRARVVQKNVT
jgi:hypothetical protein